MFRKHSRVWLRRNEDGNLVIGRVVRVNALAEGEKRYDVEYIGVDGQMEHRKMVGEEDLRVLDKSAFDITFDRLEPIMTALGDADYVKLESNGFMDLHVDKLDESNGTGERTIRVSLAHYFEQNGDLVPDPDMELMVYPDRWMAEALTYQDSMIYQEVYTAEAGKTMVRPRLKNELNRFLKLWLSNIKKQGFLKGIAA